MVTLGEGSEDGQVNVPRSRVCFLICMAESSSSLAEICRFLLFPVDTRSPRVSTGGDKSVVLVIPTRQ